MKPTLLIAEDDLSLRQGLTDLLEGEGYHVHSAHDGATALHLWREHRPDLIVLDVMMPRVNGYEVCRQIRSEDRQTPILFLTAKAEEVDQVVGLKLGGDDYVTKPFGIKALLARIEALCRRRTLLEEATPSDEVPDDQALPDTFAFGDCQVDRRRYEVTCGKQRHALTPRELHLLELFFAHRGQVLSRQRLLRDVWGHRYQGTTRTLDQHIAQMRKKIEKNPAQPRWILTAHGVGYRYAQADG